MKEQAQKRSPSPVMVAIVALFIVVASTLAWFVMEDGEVTGAYNFMISSFAKPNADVYFMNGASKVSANSYKNSDGTYNIDFENPSAVNYIGKFRVDVLITGMGESYVRVKMTHQFLEEGVTGANSVVHQYNAQMPYIINSPYLNTDIGNQRKWYDNRKNDFSFYLASPVHTSNNSTCAVVPLITGFQDSQFDESDFSGTTLKVSIEVEAVQINRYPQFWNMTELPWPGATSKTSINLSLTTTSP